MTPEVPASVVGPLMETPVPDVATVIGTIEGDAARR
jgi:hypothetical protein